jgi:hypothetical protein
METFAEVIARLAADAASPLAENIVADLTAGYNNDLSIRDAAIADRDDKLTAAEKAVADEKLESMRLKAVNYDLMVKAPAAKPVDDDNSNTEEIPAGISGLFEK